MMPPHIRNALLRYLTLAYAWLFLAWWFSVKIKEGNLWIAILGTVVLATPILLMGLYSTTVRKIHKSQQYKPGSWLQSFAGRRVLSTIMWTLFSLLSGFSALFWFGVLEKAELGLIALSVPAFPLVYRLVGSTIGTQYKGYMAVQKSLWNTQRLYALLMSLMVVALLALSPANRRNASASVCSN